MPCFRRALGALVLGSLLVNAGSAVLAQDAAMDAELRARMAAITLDERELPEGFEFQGETFLTAEQLATGDLDASALVDAGFIAQYVSVYANDAEDTRIRSYASAWTDAEAARVGFDVLEDESVTAPDGELSDGDASAGEEPREITTGTYPDPADDSVVVNTADVTYRVDRFLVGVAVETTDGEAADAELASALAAEIEGRATGAIADQLPEGTDPSLAAQALPLQGLGRELQAGFLSADEVERLYGLQGSALGSFTSSWAQAIGLGEQDAQPPFVAVGLTAFDEEATAETVVQQAVELAPDITGIETVDGVTVEGADQAVAYRFPSPATEATEIDSFRVIFNIGETVGVVDVQGAPSAEIAQQVATDLATAQGACVGQETCEAPVLADELTAP